MNYHECCCCGDTASYPTHCQCRNDVVDEMTKQGWDVLDVDGKDEWYCPSCIADGQMNLAMLHLDAIDKQSSTP